MKKLLLSAMLMAMVSATAANAADRIYTLPVFPEDTLAWDEVSATIKTLMVAGDKGAIKGNVTVSRAAGVITVAGADESAIPRIDAFIDHMSKTMAHLVSIQMKIVEVEGADSTAVDATMKQMGAAGGGVYTVSGVDDTAIVTALSQQGKVNTVTMASVTGQNNRPVPLSIMTEQNYLSKVECSNSSNCAGHHWTVRDGLQVTLTPRVLETSTMLNYSLSIFEKNGDRVQTTGLARLAKGGTMVFPYSIASGKQMVMLLTANEI